MTPLTNTGKRGIILKVIFTDLDGTLLADNKEITPGNRKAISAALAQGNQIVLTSGRPLPSVLKLANELGLDGRGCYIIASNGALIYDSFRDKILFEASLKREYVRYLMDEAWKRGIHCHSYSKSHVLCEHPTKELAYYENAIRLSALIVPDVTSYLSYDPWKVILIDRDSKETLLKFQADMEDWAKDKCASIFSCEFMLEYCPFEATKGRAVQFLCEKLHIPPEGSIAVGDAENDISMIRAAHMGVAMANASQITKDAADAVTTNDNNHDGFAEILETYVLK